MAQSDDTMDVSCGTVWQKDTHPPSKKKKRSSPPEIDCSLEMKWGLSVLGEERGKQYLAWLQEKLGQKAQQ